MTDVFDKDKRSQIMSLNKGHGNKSTEFEFQKLLTQNNITGWDVIPKNIIGKPDFAFKNEKIAVFIDGCFWHGCTKCKNIPKTNTKFWQNKIGKTRVRDNHYNRVLRNSGWLVIRIWEHELKDNNQKERIIRRLKFDIKRRQLIIAMKSFWFNSYHSF